jgi:hypothetical protein
MKQCPTCRYSYDDVAVFCGADGSQLVAAQVVQPLVAAPLTPSETVLLRAECFAPKAGAFDHKVQPPQGGDSYVAESLGRMIVAAAVLANEQVGYLRLQLAERRALLRTLNMFIVLPGPMSIRWHAESMEDLVYRYAASRTWMQVDDLVYALWQRKFGRGDVWKEASRIVLRGLLARNLVEPAGEIFGANYRLKDESAPLFAQPPDSVFALLSAAQSSPGKWDTLQNDIGLSVLRRTKTSYAGAGAAH